MISEENILKDIMIVIKDIWDYDLIIKIILNIKEDSFSDDAIKAKFRNLSNSFKILKNNPAKDIKYLKEELNRFLDSYYSYQKRKSEKILLNEAAELLDQNMVLTKRNDLLRLAKRCGYDISEESKEGTLIKSKNQGIITVIPKHKEINKFTAKGIIESLSTGERSFKRTLIFH